MNIVIRLSAESIDGGHICCLGSQLASIVSVLGQSLGDVVWYAADVDSIGVVLPICKQSPCLIGHSNRLIELVEHIDQFLRGVFLAVDPQKTNPQFRSDIDTEDSIEADLGDALVEIRAFDTTFFEILTNKEQIGAVLAKTFTIHVVSVMVQFKRL